MDQNKIQAYMMTNGNKFDAFQLQSISDRLKELPDDRYLMLAGMEMYSPTMMILVSFFAGSLGVDRFLLGQTGLGIAKLLTCGGLGIWWIIDLFLIMDETRKSNYQKFVMATA